MKEKQIEAYLRDRVKALGGVAFKFISPGSDGVPDRVVCLPGGVIAFVELKAPGKQLRPLQIYQCDRLRKLGCCVVVIDSKEQVDGFLKSLGGGAE